MPGAAEVEKSAAQGTGHVFQEAGHAMWKPIQDEIDEIKAGRVRDEAVSFFV